MPGIEGIAEQKPCELVIKQFIDRIRFYIDDMINEALNVQHTRMSSCP